MRRVRVVSALMVVSIVVSIAASTALASPVVGQSKEWTIDPPAGWQEEVAVASQLRDQMTAQKKIEYRKLEIRQWSPAAHDEDLSVQSWVMTLDGSIKGQIEAFDRGFVKGFAQSATTQDRSRQVVGSMVIRDVWIDRVRGTDVHARMVRRYQPAADGIHVLITICKGVSDLAPCEAALDRVQWTVADPTSLDTPWYARAYRLAGALGLLLVAIGAQRYVIRRRARAAAVKAAGPPG